MAISKINTRALANDSVTTDKVADNAITTDMVASGEIGVTDLADGSITNAKISATAAIAPSKIDMASVTALTMSGHLSGNTATFTGDFAINNGSPELYFGTTGVHYNWMLAAQENLDQAFEISVGSQDTDYSNDTYSKVVTVKADGNMDLVTGGLKVGGTTVIDSSRNATLAKINTTKIGDGDAGVLFNSHGGGNLDAILPFDFGNDSLYNGHVDIGGASNKFKDLHMSGVADVGSVEVGGTTVIDSSRAITATGMAVTGTVKLDGNYPTGSRNVAMGDDALGTISSGASNVALGHNASKTASSAQQTTAVGDQALYDNTASYNTAVGYRAAFNVSSGLNNTAIGTNSLYNSSTTNGNVAVGESSVYGNTGGFNIGVGNSTLRGAGAGAKNIAIGDSALRDNTSGSNQVAIGYQSLTDNLSGTRNTAVGHITLAISQTTNDNTAMGYLAGRYTTGASNTAIGAYAMSAGSSGGNVSASNVAVGKEALKEITSGGANVAVGVFALDRLTSASSNVGIGYNALSNTQTGAENVAVGREALENTIGSGNIGIGYQAGHNVYDGAWNVAIGYQALPDTVTGDFNIAIGRTTAQQMEGGTQNVAIGVDTLNAQQNGNYNVAIGGSAFRLGAAFSNGVAVGVQAGRNNTGSGNTLVGYEAGREITSGSKNSIFGSYNGNEGGLDIRTSSNNIVLSDGDGNPQFYIKGDTGATKFVGDGRSDSGAPYGGVVSMAGRTSNIGGAISSVQNWHKIYHRSFIASSFGHSIIRIEVLSNGETDGSYSYGNIIISTKQQSANDYYRVHLKSGCTNMFNRVAYKFTSTGGTQGYGALEVWFKPKSYCHTELFVNINRDYTQDINNGYVLWASTGSTTQPASSTLITAAGSDS